MNEWMDDDEGRTDKKVIAIFSRELCEGRERGK